MHLYSPPMQSGWLGKWQDEFLYLGTMQQGFSAADHLTCHSPLVLFLHCDYTLQMVQQCPMQAHGAAGPQYTNVLYCIAVVSTAEDHAFLTSVGRFLHFVHKFIV